MIVWVRSVGMCAHSGVFAQLPLSSQTFCDTEDVLELLHGHARNNEVVDEMFIDFENMKIPICHPSEFRVIAQLAAAYNNSLIEQNLRYEKDLCGRPYTRLQPAPENTDATDATAAEPPGAQDGTATKNSMTETPLQSAPAQEWDEEMHGAQVVYDDTYEQHAELDPWVMFKERRQKRSEKFAL